MFAASHSETPYFIINPPIVISKMEESVMRRISLNNESKNNIFAV